MTCWRYGGRWSIKDIDMLHVLQLSRPRQHFLFQYLILHPCNVSWVPYISVTAPCFLTHYCIFNEVQNRRAEFHILSIFIHYQRHSCIFSLWEIIRPVELDTVDSLFPCINLDHFPPEIMSIKFANQFQSSIHIRAK